MAQLAPIFRLRRQLATNRLRHFSSRRRATGSLLVLAGLGALLVGGHLAAPSLMEPPTETATALELTIDVLPAGASALEAAFWLTALLASVLNFRVLELLFRRRDVVALQTLPIEPSALFVDRFLATLMESVIAGAVASIFFLPLIWHGGPGATLACIAMLMGGLLLGALISLAVMILSTRQLIPDKKGLGGTAALPGGDVYGGGGQILLYAPAIGLGAIVIFALFWKLLLGEPLRLGHFNEPFWIGAAVLGAVALGCLVTAFRAFKEDYYAMAPRFHEADAAEFSAMTSYQESAFGRVRLWERGLAPTAASTYRALVLDDDRRIAGGRIGYAVVLILAVIGLATLELAALPFWAVAMVPAILVASIVNPWNRLFSRVNLLNSPLALPIRSVDRQIAATRATIREFFFVAIPYALAAAVVLGYFRDVGLDALIIAVLAVVSGPAVASGVSLSRRLGMSASTLRWLPSALVAIITVFAIASLLLAIGMSLLLTVAALLTLKLPETRHVSA